MQKHLELSRYIDPNEWEAMIEQEIGQALPDELRGLIKRQDGAALLCQSLPQEPFDMTRGRFPLERAWELFSLFYLNQGRFSEALSLLPPLYENQLGHQQQIGERVEKGTAPLWISECHSGLGHPVNAKRYMMYSLCEDAIRDQGTVDPDRTGHYHRMVWRLGLPDADVRRYAQRCWEIYSDDQEGGMFPDWVIQELDQQWMSEHPSSDEIGLCSASRPYVQWLLDRITPPGDAKGEWQALERLGHYLLSCIPGCRARMHQRSKSTEYDVIGVFDGPQPDFRSDIGRYFLCECKLWRKKKVDVTTVLRLSRVLDAAKCRFGIIFCLHGMSPNAEREQMKLFQDRGTVIVLVSEDDLRGCAEGANFLTLLRGKYETIRLDLPGK